MIYKRFLSQKSHRERAQRVYERDAGHKALTHAYLLSLLHESEKTTITVASRAVPVQVITKAA